MMKHETPAMRERMAEALHRRVDHLVLSGKARDKILAVTQHNVPARTWYRSGVVWAAAACLLIAVIGVVREPTPAQAHPSTHIKCVSVVHTDKARLDWSKRTIIVRNTNGTDSYIKVVAYKPQATKGEIL
jgi:hypothetical protein